MLKQLLPLLHPGDTLGLTIACEPDGRYRINTLPKLFTLDGEQGADRKALNTPLSIVGTAEEFDSPEFVNTLTRLTTSTNELRQTIENVEAEQKAAAAAKKTPPKAPVKPVAKVPAKVAAPAPAPAPAAPAPAPANRPAATRPAWKDRVSKNPPGATVEKTGGGAMGEGMLLL
jgi:PRTRC genetic system protein E